MRWGRRPPFPLRPEPDCRAVNAVLQAYLDEELGPQDVSLVAEHLRFCRRCEIDAEVALQVIDVIRRQRPDLPAGLFERLTGYVDELIGSTGDEQG